MTAFYLATVQGNSAFIGPHLTHMTLQIARHENGRKTYVRPLSFETVAEGDHAGHALTDFEPNEVYAFLQAMIDAAWGAGLRPTLSSYRQPAAPAEEEDAASLVAADLLDAKDAHLADMRAVVHHLIGERA